MFWTKNLLMVQKQDDEDVPHSYLKSGLNTYLPKENRYYGTVLTGYRVGHFFPNRGPTRAGLPAAMECFEPSALR